MTPGEVLVEVNAAVDARLTAQSARVAAISSTAYPYVSTYVSAPQAAILTDLADTRSTLVVTISTVTVGETEAQCSALLARVVDAFHNWRPAVGSGSWKIQHLAAMPPAWDDDLPDRRVWTARDTWSLPVIA